MARYGYLYQLKQYYQRYPILIDKSKLHTILVKSILSPSGLDILRYYFEELHLDINLVVDPTKYLYFQKEDILYYATKYNKFDIVRYICTSPILKDVKWDIVLAFSVSPLSNNMELLQYLYDKVKKPYIPQEEMRADSSILDNAASVGRLDMLKWLFETCGTKLKSKDLYAAAIKGNHLHIIEYLYSIDHPHATTLYQPPLLEIAVRHQSMEILKYMHANKIGSSSVNILDSAVANYEIFQWVLENLPEKRCTTDTLNMACYYGQLDVIKWLHQNRTEGCTTSAMDMASRNNKIDVVKWLHENRTEGCTVNSMNMAALNGNLELLEWLHTNRTEGCTNSAMSNAITNGHIHVVRWLDQNLKLKVPFSANISKSIIHDDIELINWFLNNSPISISNLYIAIDFGKIDLLKYLYHAKPNYFSPIDLAKRCIDNHYSKVNFEILDWLLSLLSTNSLLDILKEYQKQYDNSNLYIQQLQCRSNF